jgi:hypothetical protein
MMLFLGELCPGGSMMSGRQDGLAEQCPQSVQVPQAHSRSWGSGQFCSGSDFFKASGSNPA